ncbi:hypothetical protein P691DRAFT_805477 [Macrolepiota fuliginosa MF-IS2]|uniref:Uncharacterized protein n=1 Tax=Macrolepiota fuliginosa MF-IS2 TaxID=1400762 RepID=A0A9P5X6R9_9AGAR|nr:hypothetical protein P691DRAFT_805477 [Macrolepiota fuliginosa MF-IS2]
MAPVPSSIPSSIPSSAFQDIQLLPSLPPELILEIVSCVVEPSSKPTNNGPYGDCMSFSSRMKTLTNLSLTTPSLRALILSSPTFWSQIEIKIIKDSACSPPLPFLNELFARSREVKMSVRVVHWGEEHEDFNQGKGWEWIPGATREVRKLLERNEHRIEKLCFEFHHLNGTEYTSRGGVKGSRWQSLRHLEMYASDWAHVHSMQMDWMESVLAEASPETVIVRGSGAFGWSVLGKDMCRMKRLRIETEVPEILAVRIVSRTPALEDCNFGKIIQVSQVGSQSRSGPSGGIELSALRRLHVGSMRGVGPFLNMIATPRLRDLEVDFVETKKARWDQEVFARFIDRSGLGSRLRKLVVRRGAMSQASLRECEEMFSPKISVDLVS